MAARMCFERDVQAMKAWKGRRPLLLFALGVLVLVHLSEVHFRLAVTTKTKPPEETRLFLASMLPATNASLCQGVNQERLETDGRLHLEASLPFHQSFEPGETIRIPIYIQNKTLARLWKYDLWARLVSSSVIIPFQRIEFFDNYSETGLFAQVEFHVWDPYSSNVANVFPTHFGNFMPVTYMGRENDLESWRKQMHGDNKAWTPFHLHWIDNHCFGIQGSPYTLQVVRKQNPARTTIGRTRRMCTIEDTMKPGYWRMLDVDCANTSGSHPGCGYLWGTNYRGQGMVYETPGCEWAFLNHSQLSSCFPKYSNQINFVGDSLIRMMEDQTKNYLKFVNYTEPLTIHQDFKRVGESGQSVDQKDGRNFTTTYGVFIDDYAVIHKVGWGLTGAMGGGESSPGRLAHELSQRQSWLKNKTGGARMIYYMPHYLNEYRLSQGFEPYLSFYSALTWEFIKSEFGYEIFNANQRTRGIPDHTFDGFHYDQPTERIIALVLLNSLCN